MYSIVYILFMRAGYHIMAWRRYRGLTQVALADRAGLTRPYLSRLEKNKADPALSVLRRLAQVLEIGPGQLIDALPPEQALDRQALDQLARGALHPGRREVRGRPEVRVLARMIKERRKALGLYHGRVSEPSGKELAGAENASQWLRAAFGEKQWKALLRRIDKLASGEANA